MPSSDKPESDSSDKPAARVDFARRLRELRVKNGYRTARSLAKAVGIDENRYTRYERAEVEPDLTLIRELVVKLATTPNELLGPTPAYATGFHDGGVGPAAIEGAPGQRSVGTTPAERANGISWALARIIADARTGSANGQGVGLEGARPTVPLPTLGAIYQQLSVDAFAFVATERGLSHAPDEVQNRIRELLDDLARALAE